MKIFPPIVTDMQKKLTKLGFDLNNDQVYQLLVKQNFINADCTPTNWAIEQGYISGSFTFPHGLHPAQKEKDDGISDEDFDAVLSRVPKNAFLQTSKGLAIEQSAMKKAILDAIANQALSDDGVRRWSKVLLAINKEEGQDKSAN